MHLEFYLKSKNRMNKNPAVFFSFLQLTGNDWKTQTATIICILFLVPVGQWFDIYVSRRRVPVCGGASLMNCCSKHITLHLL